MRKFPLPFGALFLGALFVAQPQPTHAATVVAALCAVQQYPCLGGNILDSGVRTNFVGGLGANRFTIMPFSFADAAVSFTGTTMATDVAGKWIYLWATGTATDILGGALTLDVAFQQTNYLTVPGLWGFNDMVIGGCAGGTAANSGAVAQGAVNATGLSILTGNCSVNNPFVRAGIPVGGGLGFFTTLTAAAQFVFTAGSAAGSTIALPWGDDFPDPNVLGDPSSLGFIDPSDTSDITSLGLTPGATTPEPGTMVLLGIALAGLGFVNRRRRV
jgi:PEP-CTERM motif-containing protein